MPCTYGPDEVSISASQTKRLSTYEEMLCSACRSLEKVNFDFGVNPMLDKWWAQHKAVDAKRELEEKLVNHLLKNKNVGDLTNEDKALLRKHGYL